MNRSSHFRSRAFVLDHLQKTMNFFHPTCLDPAGGFYTAINGDGLIKGHRSRSLVHSCRFLFNEANAYLVFGRDEYRCGVRHALDFLLTHHRIVQSGGYRWSFDFEDGVRSNEDNSNITYGFSFVVLAQAMAIKAGFSEAKYWLEEVVETMERHFFDATHMLYADQASADFQTIAPYRGQNANMHACEGMIAAFEATGDSWYIDRAETIAQAIAIRQAALSPLNQIWEHYHSDWSLDPDFNRHNDSDGLRSWGFLPGHQLEWAKLLLMIEQHKPAAWHVPRAKQLFDQSMALGWDETHGGIFYSYKPDKTPHDRKKYQWVHAEALGAAIHLAHHTGEAHYWTWYDRLWHYVWQHFVDPAHGSWYRLLHTDNSIASDVRGDPEPDYHNMGACVEILKLIKE